MIVYNVILIFLFVILGMVRCNTVTVMQYTTKYTKTIKTTPATVIIYKSKVVKTLTSVIKNYKTVTPSPAAISTVKSYTYKQITLPKTATLFSTVTHSNFITYTVK